MKNLLILFFVFLSFNSFSQNEKLTNIRENLILDESVEEIRKDLVFVAINSKADTTFIFNEIREKASKLIERDTLILFSFGGMGYNSREGTGNYDSITINYSFLYLDVSMDCLNALNYQIGKWIYNSIIKNEITRRHGKNWEIDIQNKIESLKSNQSKKE